MVADKFQQYSGERPSNFHLSDWDDLAVCTSLVGNPQRSPLRLAKWCQSGGARRKAVGEAEFKTLPPHYCSLTLVVPTFDDHTLSGHDFMKLFHNSFLVWTTVSMGPERPGYDPRLLLLGVRYHLAAWRIHSGMAGPLPHDILGARHYAGDERGVCFRPWDPLGHHSVLQIRHRTLCGEYSKIK